MWAIIRATARPFGAPSANAGSRRIAARPTAEKPMFCALSRALAQMTAARSISSGASSAHCSACIPPSDPPTAACSRSTPSVRSSARCTVLRSRTVIRGKSRPYGSPVAGSIDDGPVVPWQPPRRFAHTTKKRSVSTARPGPTSVLHQSAASASPVSAWQMSTALPASASSVP